MPVKLWLYIGIFHLLKISVGNHSCLPGQPVTHEAFPLRPDCLSVVDREMTDPLKSSKDIAPGQWYHTLFAIASFGCKDVEAAWLGCLRSQIDGRYFPISDHHIRGFSIIGDADRCLWLFSSFNHRK